MIKDKLTTFANNIAATSAGIFGDVIDLEKSGLDIGAGEPVYLVATATTAITGGPATLSLVTSDNDDLSGGIALISVSITTAPAGATFIAMPLPIADYKRYIGISIGGTPLTAGNLDISLALDVPNSKAYPRG